MTKNRDKIVIFQKKIKKKSWYDIFAIVWKKTLEVNGYRQLFGYQHHERRSYRFGTRWGWVINDRIFIFGWTIPLNKLAR